MFKKKLDPMIIQASAGEIQFLRLSNDHLKSILDEINELSEDNFIKKVIENGLERYELDKLIHARLLFK